MTTRKFRDGLRSAEVVHYDVGLRRKLVFDFDGVDTVHVVASDDHHGLRPAVETSAGIALNEDEVYQLAEKLTAIWAQMAEERKKREEWEAQHSQ